MYEAGGVFRANWPGHPTLFSLAHRQNSMDHALFLSKFSIETSEEVALFNDVVEMGNGSTFITHGLCRRSCGIQKHPGMSCISVNIKVCFQ